MAKKIKSYNYRELNKLEKIANSILDLENEIKILSDEELKNKTFEFKERFIQGESLDSLLVEVFAVCREATFRVLGKKQYKVQIIGGIVLHQGRVAEMKTGEGKTLTELCPAYLNSITGKGVHIITVNEYLAKRDMLEMKALFEFLNISVGLVLEDTEDKSIEYEKDIVYSTNTELGFDYLRDNLVYTLEDKVQRELNYVIIDEVDSVLIDEARTPLVISAQAEEANNIYVEVDIIVSKLNEDDYKLDRKEDTIFLSEKGVSKIEEAFKISNLSDSDNLNLNHIINQALKANFLMDKNIDYIIDNEEIVLIDANTGRIAEGRRFSDGLHQCLEAKENVKINSESKTIASITYQSFFKLYKKMSGMSGTVKTEEPEFREIYNLDVITIPTNKIIQREDKVDRVFIDKESKIEAIIEDIKTTSDKGQPILVGTISIEESELLSNRLKNIGIKHKLLNAKTKLEESEIISRAGELNSITIATNIAGRGTDIKISQDALCVGGLKVIGTERSESLRIDNQLIGRSGRQGDFGQSQFYVSCDDKLLAVYGEGKLKKYLKRKKYNHGEIDYKYAEKYIVRAQKTINAMNYEVRKNTVEYDYVINMHRELIYKERDEILSGKYINHIVSNIILESVKDMAIEKYSKVTSENIKGTVNVFDLDLADLREKDRIEIYKELSKLDKKFHYEFSDEEIETLYKITELHKIIDYMIVIFINYFNDNFIENLTMNQDIMRNIFIGNIDFYWQEHLVEMEHLKLYARDQTYNQKKPIDVYKLESGVVVKELFYKIRKAFAANLFEYFAKVD